MQGNRIPLILGAILVVAAAAMFLIPKKEQRKWRMNMNFYIGVGLYEYGLDPEDYGIDSYDVGDLTYMKG